MFDISPVCVSPGDSEHDGVAAGTDLDNKAVHLWDVAAHWPGSCDLSRNEF